MHRKRSLNIPRMLISIENIYRLDIRNLFLVLKPANSMIDYIMPGAQNVCISTTILICILVSHHTIISEIRYLA